MERIICILIGVIFGNILTAEFVVKRAIGKRPKDIGSGNPGMANVMTELGVKWGLLVLAGDIVKTAAACAVCDLLFGDSIGRLSIFYAGIGAVIGHNYPIWNHGKGGKGVAVTCMFIVLYSPLWGMFSLAAGAIAVLASGYLAIGGITITATYSIFMVLTGNSEVILLSLLTLLLMVIKHGKTAVREATGKGEKVLLFRKDRQK